jgi:hypothetical protein
MCPSSQRQNTIFCGSNLKLLLRLLGTEHETRAFHTFGKAIIEGRCRAPFPGELSLAGVRGVVHPVRMLRKRRIPSGMRAPDLKAIHNYSFGVPT